MEVVQGDMRGVQGELKVAPAVIPTIIPSPYQGEG